MHLPFSYSDWCKSTELSIFYIVSVPLFSGKECYDGRGDESCMD